MNCGDAIACTTILMLKEMFRLHIPVFVSNNRCLIVVVLVIIGKWDITRG